MSCLYTIGTRTNELTKNRLTEISRRIERRGEDTSLPLSLGQGTLSDLHFFVDEY